MLYLVFSFSPIPSGTGRIENPTYLTVSRPILMILYLFAAICCEPSYRVCDHFEPERVTSLYINPLYFIFNDTLLIISPRWWHHHHHHSDPIFTVKANAGSSRHYRYCRFAYKFGTRTRLRRGRTLWGGASLFIC